MFHGPRINTFLFTVEAAGPKELLARLLIELTSLETEPGLTFLCHLRSSSIVKLEEAAMVEILEEFMPLPRPTEFLKKVVKIIWPRIQLLSAAQPSKNAKTADIPRDKSQEIKETAGQPLNIQSGKSTSMVELLELIK